MDNTLNQNGPNKFHIQLPMIVDGKILSTHFFISNLGKEDVILGLPWLTFINPEVDWTRKILRVIESQIKLPSIKRCILHEFEVREVEIVQERKNSHWHFAKEIQNLPKRKGVTMEEVTDEETTPKHPRFPDTEKSILIAVNELPDDYENRSALPPD